MPKQNLASILNNKKKSNRPLTFMEICLLFSNCSKLEICKKLKYLEMMGLVKKTEFKCYGYKIINKKDINGEMVYNLMRKLE